MLMSKIECEIIRDLFPSYINHLTNQISDKAIKNHLENCKACRKILEHMSAENKTNFVPSGSDKKEIDFLKKNKRSNLRIIFASLSVAVFIIVAVLFFKLYVIGDWVYGYGVACDVKVDGNNLTVEGNSVDSARVISHIEFSEQDQIVNINTKAVLASPIYKTKFHEQYIAKNNIRQVKLNERVIWDNGKNISPLALSVYETKHDFVGDMSANIRTAGALAMSGFLGAFTNEMETSYEPYTWKLTLKDDILSSDKTLKESDMESFAYILIAVIGNLDRVTYEYTVDGVARTKTIDLAAATKFFGQNIKGCGKSVRLLDELIDKTGLK